MIFAYRLWGIAVALIFTYMSLAGQSCSDDRNTGISSSGRGTSASGYRTYHK